MSNILITGATGNIGMSVIRFLNKTNPTKKLIAGVRNIEKAQQIFNNFENLQLVHFDFEDSNTFDTALAGIDRVFLLRPPHISDVAQYFNPLIASLKKNRIQEVVFLSVQGAEKSKVIPHNKIERLIKESGINYIFLRPSYFMQNLTTTLLNDIETKRAIILPAGKAKFNWIDIENIGEAAAILLTKFEMYKNQAIEITGPENENFEKVTSLINLVVKNPIAYKSLNPLRFYAIKKSDGMVTGMILVMLLLHYLPRFQPEPAISDFYTQLTGKQPTNLKTFIEREKAKFERY